MELDKNLEINIRTAQDKAYLKEITEDVRFKASDLIGFVVFTKTHRQPIVFMSDLKGASSENPNLKLENTKDLAGKQFAFPDLKANVLGIERQNFNIDEVILEEGITEFNLEDIMCIYRFNLLDNEGHISARLPLVRVIPSDFYLGHEEVKTDEID